MKQITPDMAAGLWQHLSSELHSEVVDKQNNTLMEAVGWLLDAFDVMDHERFLADFGTTFIRTIYLPFTPGELSPRWPAATQCSMAIHEHEHVWQYQEDGFVFVAGYLTKKSSRATWEALAYRTNMEFTHWSTGSLSPDAPAYYAEKIRSYGCGDDEVAFVRDFLEMSVPVILDGEIISPVVQSAVNWLESHGDIHGPISPRK